MSRSAVFYVVKAMERTAAGTDAPRVPAGQAVDREAPARPDGSAYSLVRRVLAAVQHSIGGPGTAARGRRRPGRAARAD